MFLCVVFLYNYLLYFTYVMLHIDFSKMHGLGNDFVIVDDSDELYCRINTDIIKAIADRRTGVGCDQFLLLKKSQNADCFMFVYNQDGSEAEACGNGTRCVARLLMDENGLDSIKIETVAGILSCRKDGNLTVVNMGLPKLHYSEIPISIECDTDSVPIDIAGFPRPFAVNMGNPHIIFFYNDIENLDIKKYGSFVENHEYLPKGANISWVKIIDSKNVKVRVWERGVGETLVCGSASCAITVAMVRNKLLDYDQELTLHFTKGSIFTYYNNKGVYMKGETALVFRGSYFMN